MPEDTAILADIGGTNARFALLEDGQVVARETYAVAEHASPVDAALAFLRGPAAGRRPNAAAIAVAGPVAGGRVAMTNAHWTVDETDLRAGLGLSRAHV